MSNQRGYSTPEVGDYVMLWDDIYPETTNFAVISEYCWSEASTIHDTIWVIADERGALLTIIRFNGLDTYQHQGWQHIIHRIDDGKFRQYLDNKKEKENET